MTRIKDQSRTAASRDRVDGNSRRRSVLNDHPTAPRENPPLDGRRMALAREDWGRVLGN